MIPRRVLLGRSARALLLLVAALASGCGFQLRGQATLPAAMDRTRIEAPRDARELVGQLSRLLEGNGVEVVAGEEPGAAVLAIDGESLTREVQSVGPRARVREFVLLYRVSFRVLEASGETLLPPRELLLRRDYTFDQNQVLGTTSEEELIGRSLRREMASRMVAAMSAN